MKVVCVDDRPPLPGYLEGVSFPNGFLSKGETYTAIETYNADCGDPLFVIEEKPILWPENMIRKSHGWGAFRFVTPEYYEAEFTETESESVKQPELQPAH